jgi:hypothetical protein
MRRGSVTGRGMKGGTVSSGAIEVVEVGLGRCTIARGSANPVEITKDDEHWTFGGYVALRTVNAAASFP